MPGLDFKGLGDRLLGRARDLIATWLPGGKLIGHEYCCSDLRGGQGDSLKVNVETGVWADFATDHKGGDLTSLYAAIEGITQGDAARALADQIGFEMSADNGSGSQKHVHRICKPPEDAGEPSLRHPQHGEPVAHWIYRSSLGQVLFYVSRYETPQGKQIIPTSWCDLCAKWVARAWPAPRPLYGLESLARRPNRPVMVVEGEKAADAARKLVGDFYVVVTWPNGSKAVRKADWGPLRGRTVLIWPDRDEPGVECGTQIARILDTKCKEIKLLDVGTDGKGWDAADALRSGWDWDKLLKWAKRIAHVYKSPDRDAEGVQAVQINNFNVIMPDQDVADLSNYALWEKLGLAVTTQGAPICNVDNVLRVMDGIPKLKGLVWYDEFHQRYFTRWDSKRDREWADIDDLNLTAYMQRIIGLSRLSDDVVAKAVAISSHRVKRHAPRDWMTALKWDGEERIEHFFMVCMGVDDNEYSRAASRNFWIGMVARIFQPGCQVDSMVVLEGAQGVGKTKALRAIGGRWHVEASESVTSKDFYLMLQGKFLIEIAEMDSFSNAEVTRIKQVITCTNDSYRAPYARRAADHPRSCVFVGSTNNQQYLRDDTGARRFWPVKCKFIDIDKIRAMRENLFAEAVHYVGGGAAWHIMPAEATAIEQELRRQGDEWEMSIQEYVFDRARITVTDVWVDCLGGVLARLDKRSQMRIASSLKALKWTPRDGRVNGKKERYWIPQGSDGLGESLKPM